MTTLRRTMLALALSALASACGGGGGGGDGGVQLDTTPPTASFSPVAGATGVARATSVVVTFSEPVQPASVSASTVTVTGPGGAVAATRTLSAGNTVLTITPSAPLANFAAITIQVGTGVRDAAGNAFTAAASASFTTVDDVAPVAPGTPAGPQFASLAAPNPTFSWSAPTDDGSGVAGYDVEAVTSPAGAAVFTAAVAGTSTPLGNQSGRDGQAIVVRVRARDVAGNVGPWTAFSAPVQVDVTAPAAVLTPANGATGVSRTGDLQVTFSEAMVPATVASAVTLSEGVTPVSFTGTLSGNALPVAHGTLTNFAQHTLAVSTAATDLAGNPLAAAASATFTTADTVAPVAPGTPAGPQFANRATRNPTFSWSAPTDDGSGVAGYDVEAVTSPAGEVFTAAVAGTSTPLGDQSGRDGQAIVVRVRARDVAGNVGPWTAYSAPVQVDVTAPTAVLAPAHGATGVSRTNDLQVTFSEAMVPATVASAVTLSEGVTPVSWTGTLSGNALPVAHGTLANYAQHTLAVSTAATDLAGNPVAAVSATFRTADTVAPTAPGTPTGPAYANLAAANPTFSWTASSDDGSGVASYDVEAVTSPAGAAVYSGGAAGTSSPVAVQLSDDGQSIVVRVRPRDGSGNVGPWTSYSAPVLVDLTAPTAVLAPADGATDVSRTSALQITFSEAMAAGTVSGAVSLAQGATPVTWTGSLSGNVLPVAHATLANYAQHTLTVAATATDLAGNPLAAPVTSSFRTADTVAPATPAAPTGPAYANLASPSATFSWVAPTDDGAGVASYDWVVATSTSGSPASIVRSGAAWISTSFTESGLGLYDGQRIYARVQARDAASNASAYSPWSAGVQVDLTAPAAGPVTDPGAFTGPSVAFSWPASSDATGIAEYEVRIATVVPSFGAAPDALVTSPGFTLDASSAAYLDGVEIFVSVRAVDGAGNAGAAAVSDGVVLDKTPPGAPGTPQGPGAFALTFPVSFTWAAATDSASGVASYQVTASTSTTGTPALPVTHTPATATSADVTAGDGATVYVRVTATDVAGNAGTPSGWSSPVRVDLVPPTQPGTPQRPAGSVLPSPVAFSWTASTDTNGVAWYEVQVTTAAGGAGDPVFSGTVAAAAATVPAAEAQTIHARVRAVDVAGRAGPWSGSSAPVVVDASGPSAPGQPVVPGVTSASLHVAWTAANDAASAVATYFVQVGTDPGFGAGTFKTLDAGNFEAVDVSVGEWDGLTVFARVRADDVFGHQGPWSITSDPVVVDATPPVATQDPQDAGSVSSSLALHFYWAPYQDPTSGVAEYQCAFAVGPTGPTTPVGTPVSSASPSCDFMGSYGDRVFVQVRARDGAGNWSGFGSWSDGILLDASAPGTPGTPMDTGDYSTVAAVSWTWLPPADWTPADAWVIHVGSSPGASDVETLETAAGAPPFHSRAGVDGVTYYLTVAVKRAGVTGAFSAGSDGITVDTTAPGAPGTPALAAQAGGMLTFDWAPAPEPHTGIASYEVAVYLNGGATPVTTQLVPTERFDWNAWDGDTVAIEVRATNAAGLTGPWSARSTPVTIDAMPPWAWSQTAGWNGTPTNVDLVVAFSEAMDLASVEAAFSLTWGAGATPAHGYEFHWSADQRTLTVVPDTQDPAGVTNLDLLPEATDFVMAIGTGATDLAGNPLSSPFSFSFTTRDETAPQLVSVVEKRTGAPSPFDPSFTQSVTVLVTFDEEMNAGRARVRVETMEDGLEGSIRSAAIQGATTSPGRITYQLQSCFGVDLRVGDLVSVFDAQPAYQVTRVPVVAFAPPCDVTVAVSSVPPEAFMGGGWMTIPSDGPDRMRVQWVGPATLQVELPPYFSLLPGAEALLELWDVSDPYWNYARSVRPTLQAAALGDTTAPTLVSSVPAADATNVRGVSPVLLRFSEPLAEATVAGIGASCPGCAGLYVTEYAPDRFGPLVVLTPRASPPPGAHVTITVPATVKDLAGNAVLPFTVSFDVDDAVETGAPELRETTPPASRPVANVWRVAALFQDSDTGLAEPLDARTVDASDLRVVDLSTGLLLRGVRASVEPLSGVIEIEPPSSSGFNTGWQRLDVSAVSADGAQATYTTGQPHGMAALGASVTVNVYGDPSLSAWNARVVAIPAPDQFTVQSPANGSAGGPAVVIGEAHVPTPRSYEVALDGIPGADGIQDAQGNPLDPVTFTLDLVPWGNRVPFVTELHDLRLYASSSSSARSLSAEIRVQDPDLGFVTASLWDPSGVFTGTEQVIDLGPWGGGGSYRYPMGDGGGDGPPDGTNPARLAEYGGSGYYPIWLVLDDGVEQTQWLRDLWIWATDDVPLLASITDGGEVRTVGSKPLVLENGGLPAFSWTRMDAANADLGVLYVVALDAIEGTKGGYEEVIPFAPKAAGSLGVRAPLEPDVYLWTVVQQKFSPGSFELASSGWALDFASLPSSLFAVGPSNRDLADQVFAGAQAGFTRSPATGAVAEDAMGTWTVEGATAGAAPVEALAALRNQDGVDLPVAPDLVAYETGKRFTMTQNLAGAFAPLPMHGVLGRGGTFLAVAQETEFAPGIRAAAAPLRTGSAATSLDAEFAFVQMDAQVGPLGPSFGGGVVGYAIFDPTNVLSVSGRRNDGTAFPEPGDPAMSYAFDGATGLLSFPIDAGRSVSGYLAGQDGAEFAVMATTDSPGRFFWLLAARARTWTGAEDASLLAGVYRFASFGMGFDATSSSLQQSFASSGTLTFGGDGTLSYAGASGSMVFSGQGTYAVDPATRTVTVAITTGPGAGQTFTAVLGPDTDTVLALGSYDPAMTQVLVLSR